MRLGQELCSVILIRTATILDDDLAGITKPVIKQGTNECAHLFGIVSRSRDTSANGPYRFIGDNQPIQAVFRKSLQCCQQLTLHNSLGITGVSLFQDFPNTEHCVEILFKHSCHLLAHNLIVFTEQRAALAAGQWWRLWSGHLVHLDARHAAVNLAALALLAVAASRMRCLAALLGASALMMPLASLGLLLADPGLQWYAGLSGLLHAWAAWLLLRHGGATGTAGLCLLAAKLLWETLPGTAGAAGGSFPVALEAHRIGIVAGLLLAAPAAWRRRPRR